MGDFVILPKSLIFMNKTKKNKAIASMPKPGAQQAPKSAASGNGKQKAKGGAPRNLSTPFYPVIFLLLWIFCSFIYGSVFHDSQQSSFFAWDKTLMDFFLGQKLGWLYVVGRFVLLSYHYSIFGGAVLALMLTLVTWLLNYLIGLRGILRVIPTVVPFAYLSYFVGLCFSINYHRETSLLMGIPLMVLVVLAICALVKRLVLHTKPECIYKTKWENRMAAYVNNGVVLAMFLAISVFSLTQRDDLIRTCNMKTMLENSEWEDMIEEAQGCKRPSRHVAAYYAIALAQTGQLQTKLFDIPYNFPRRKVMEMDGQESDGIEIYTLDCDFFAGLPNSSYHYSMESMVKNGPQVRFLKCMARAALINGEKRLCWKYLQILDCVPFEHAFVEKYKAWLNNMAGMMKDPDFAHVYNKMPLHDCFDQRYRKPLFIGYNVELMEGRSGEALHASLMSLLYSKDLNGFLMRAKVISGNTLPEYYQQAILVKSIINGEELLNAFPTVERNAGMARIKYFVKEGKPYFKQQPVGQKILKDDWMNYYPYYMYFENLPEEDNNAAKTEETKKGGVN